MEFDVFPMRKDGRLLPRHVMWAGKVRGALFVLEERDVELHRSIRVAKIIRTAPHAQLLPALFDAILIGRSVQILGRHRSRCHRMVKVEHAAKPCAAPDAPIMGDHVWLRPD